ncbi:MAG: VWA domain-containing protein [Pseudomonadota bacterium]
MRDLIDDPGPSGSPERPENGAPGDAALAWSMAGLVASLVAVAPAALGGARLRAGPGPARDAWLSGLRALMGEAPWCRLPQGAPASVLDPSLDLAATLAAGRPVSEPGLFARAGGGVLVLPGAERLDRALAARLAQACDAGPAVPPAADGAPSPPNPLLVALDEGHGQEGEDGLPPALADRLAFSLALDAIPLAAITPIEVDHAALQAARQRYARLLQPEGAAEALTVAAARLGIASLRPVLQALAAARAIAAVSGEEAAGEAELMLATELVLIPRATCLPTSEGAEETPAPPPPEDQSAPPPDTPPDSETEPPDDGRAEMAGEMADRLLEAVQAGLAGDVLAALLAMGPRRAPGSSGGSAGGLQTSTRRGRPAGIRQGMPGAQGRLALVETLSAAAPWQPLRRRARRLQTPATDGPRRLEIRRGDLRLRRYKTPRETLTIFVVDASGSAALARLAEAKGAVELMLSEAYRRRDAVAVVAFRREGAEVLLPPTRALARAKRALAGLPGGGATPLAAGLDAARVLAAQAQRQGQSVSVVLLSDGKANIARDGAPGRVAAREDAEAAGRALQLTGAACIVIDTGPAAARAAVRASGRTATSSPARAIADAMGARFLALPGAGAEAIAAAASLAPGGSGS